MSWRAGQKAKNTLAPEAKRGFGAKTLKKLALVPFLLAAGAMNALAADGAQ